MTDIRVTIDCEGEYCGNCQYPYYGLCRMFDCDIETDIQVMPPKLKRCQQCLDAEIKE